MYSKKTESTRSCRLTLYRADSPDQEDPLGVVHARVQQTSGAGIDRLEAILGLRTDPEARERPGEIVLERVVYDHRRLAEALNEGASPGEKTALGQALLPPAQDMLVQFREVYASFWDPAPQSGVQLVGDIKLRGTIEEHRVMPAPNGLLLADQVHLRYRCARLAI